LETIDKEASVAMTFWSSHANHEVGLVAVSFKLPVAGAQMASTI